MMIKLKRIIHAPFSNGYCFCLMQGEINLNWFNINNEYVKIEKKRINFCVVASFIQRLMC